MSKASNPSTTGLTRREASSLALLSVMSAAIVGPLAQASEIDPVFAAIEKNRRAYQMISQAVAVLSPMPVSDPGYEGAYEATGVAWDVFDSSCEELLSIQPTTMPGVLALLGYIDEFNLGRAGPGTDRDHSDAEQWPDHTYQDETVRLPNGGALSMRWPYWILRNVHLSLSALASNT